MLDELIRAALNEAAMACTVPGGADQHALERIVWHSESGVKGAPDE